MGVDRLFSSEDRQPWAPKPGRRIFRWLIGITVGVFLLLALIKGSLSESAKPSMAAFIQDWFAVSPDGLLGGRVWQLFTYQLIHGGGRPIWHLLFNMVVLYFVGSIYEQLRGGRNLLWTYFLCGAVAGLACFLEEAHVVGASGSILALLLVLAVQIPNQQVVLLIFPMRMKWVAVIIVSLDVLQLLGAGGHSQVASFTHLTGALAGFVYGYVWPRYFSGRLTRASADRRERRKAADREKQIEESVELDRILDKISRVGMQDLTADERKFLRRASQKLQDSGPS